MLEQPNSPKPRSPPPVTQSQEFKFSSEERVRLHKEVLEPMKKSRLSQAEREKLVRVRVHVSDIVESVDCPCSFCGWVCFPPPA